MKKQLIIFSILLLGYGYLAAQQDTTGKKPSAEMNVDMPDETQETDLLDKSQLQIEAGMVYNRYKNGPASVIGQALIRYGIASRLELRLLLEDGRQRDRYINETVQSTFPLAAGAKFSVIKDVNGLPDITLVGYLKLPFTNRSGDQKPYWSPILLAAFQNKFAHDKLKLEYNIGGQQEAYGTDWAILASASINYQLTRQLEVYVEYYAQYQPGDEPRNNMGGGLAYQIGKSVKIFASTGGSIQQQEGNHFFNGGAAVRIP